MIGALRQGSSIYMLDKSAGLKMQACTIDSVTAPQPKFGQAYSLTPETTIDMVVRMSDGTTADFKGVPTGVVSANFGNVVISETKEAVLNEVEGLMRMADEAIKKEGYYRSIIEDGERIREELNPNIAKEKETERRIVNLEGSIGRIEEMLAKALKK